MGDSRASGAQRDGLEVTRGVRRLSVHSYRVARTVEQKHGGRAVGLKRAYKLAELLRPDARRERNVRALGQREGRQRLAEAEAELALLVHLRAVVRVRWSGQQSEEERSEKTVDWRHFREAWLIAVRMGVSS